MSRRAARPRDAEGTRRRIVDAARKEFGTKGFQGARVEGIARRAGVNKGLIFYYFRSKEGLFSALALERLSPRAQPPVEGLSPEDPFQWPQRLFALGEETVDWVRFFLWEGLQTESSPPALLMEEPRRASFQRRVAWVRQQQDAGVLPATLDAAQLTFFLYVLGVYPYMIPQFAYLITGATPTEERFRTEFQSFIADLARLLEGRA